MERRTVVTTSRSEQIEESHSLNPESLKKRSNESVSNGHDDDHPHKQKIAKSSIDSRVDMAKEVVVLPEGPKTVLQLFQEENGQANVHFKFSKSPHTPIVVCDTKEDFLKFLKSTRLHCEQTTSRWIHAPFVPWIKSLWFELSPKAQQLVHERFNATASQYFKQAGEIKSSKNKRKRRESKSNADEVKFETENIFEYSSHPHVRWGAWSDVAGLIMFEWFRNNNDLEKVICKMREFKQDMLPLGAVVRGKFVRKQFSKVDPLNLTHLKEKLMKFYPNVDDPINIFKLEEKNPFRTEPYQIAGVSNIGAVPRTGSLNTVWNFMKPNVDAPEDLAGYHQNLTTLLASDPNKNSFLLNQDLYFIWKFRDYVTAYHQDAHTFPHTVLYNQTSGVSTFHFLPPLLGHYVTFIGREYGEQLRSLLEDIDARKIGHLVNACAGDVLYILPSGAHGVWVPHVSEKMEKNLDLEPFQVSSIRAAEIYLSDLNSSLLKETTKRNWDPFCGLL